MVDIPKNLNRNCPHKVKPIKVMNETMVARLMICFLSSLLRPLVMVKNTGIVPSGLVNVKKEVKHKSA